MKTETIEVETVNSTQISPPPGEAQNPLAIQRIETGGAVGRAMTIDELHKQLEFIRDVMRKEMKEGQDYGNIPGTDRKTLLQPGAQKLLMTFNLMESVKKEILREFASMPMHREYEFTITVTAPNGKTWDGVGTCSTLESKYRYRKSSRKCPVCGKEAIIEGKAEYGGGFVCFKKKQGCGAKFVIDDPRITSQAGGLVENEDPADVWNTVRKMAFKRGLVHASINATNTSELWTQDMEDMAGNEEVQKERERFRNSGRTSSQKPPSTTPPPDQNTQVAKLDSSNAKSPSTPLYAAPKTRDWMIKKLSECRDLAEEYFRKLSNPSVLLPNETLENLPLKWVPISHAQLKLLQDAIGDFGNGGEAKHPYPSNPEPPGAKPPGAKPKQAQADPQRAPAPHLAKARTEDPEWWRDVIVPIPPRGVKRADYMKAPQTVGQLYDGRHDEETAKRLFGFIGHFEVKTTWVNGEGKTVPCGTAQIENEKAFREALDACSEYHEKHKGDTDEESAILTNYK